VRKVLFSASVLSHIKAFHIPYLVFFKENGFEIHVAARNNLGEEWDYTAYIDELFDINVNRSPLKIENVRVLRELTSIIAENNYALIHCHTPVVGVLTRLAARTARKNGTKVLYTAHGFHFYKGASFLNWLVFYPVEKIASKWADCLITINREDYELALNRGFKSHEIVYIPGVGVDLGRFTPVDSCAISKIRAEYGYCDDDFLLLYAAELNRNKHQDLLIRSVAEIAREVPTVRLLLAGEGPLMQDYKSLAAELGVSKHVDFVGYRNDIHRIVPMCDVIVASSYREGLPVNVMEAMACGKPIIATRNRGHVELVRQGENGFLVEPDDYLSLAEYALSLFKDPDLRVGMGKKSYELVEPFSLSNVYSQMVSLYGRFLT
jgi:glycosyltransferase EpsD